jgi:CDP-paratose 2-epimerase
MSVVIVTGAGGLIGSETARHFASLGLDVVGVDNDMRARFFGQAASVNGTLTKLRRDLGKAFTLVSADIRNRQAIDRLFQFYGQGTSLVVHTAAQPSHDYAATEPFLDFDVNAGGTLNLLEAARRHAPGAAFVHCSTNKVYGDAVNLLPYVEKETRFEVHPSHPLAEHGVDESMSIDGSTHSLFGCSKLAGDVLVQEYGRYFGMNTVVFRGGTLTGPAHMGVEAHGYLSYLMKCNLEGRVYKINGYRGKMVRDSIHSKDVVSAFDAYWRDPRPAAVYNIGGGRAASSSHIEAFALAEKLTGKEMLTEYVTEPRRGDHRWWISDTRAFQRDYPDWRVTYDVPAILSEIHAVHAGA